MKDVKGWDYGSVYNTDKCVSRPDLVENWCFSSSRLLTLGYSMCRFVKPTYVVTPMKAEKSEVPIRVTGGAA